MTDQLATTCLAQKTPLAMASDHLLREVTANYLDIVSAEKSLDKLLGLKSFILPLIQNISIPMPTRTRFQSLVNQIDTELSLLGS